MELLIYLQTSFWKLTMKFPTSNFLLKKRFYQSNLYTNTEYWY